MGPIAWLQKRSGAAPQRGCAPHQSRHISGPIYFRPARYRCLRVDAASHARPSGIHRENPHLPKTEIPLAYIREIPDTAPNSHKRSASLIWLFFAEGEGHHAPLMYVPGRSWFVYNKCWVEQRDDLLEFTVLLQTSFLKCAQDVRAAVAAMNIFKATRRGETHHRRKYLLDLEGDISDSLKIQIVARNARRFFARAAPMDGAHTFSRPKAQRSIYGRILSGRVRRSTT